MTDHVRLWSDELARDPASLVFLPLAETLRRRGQVELARKVATRGVERHPENPDAHDQLARILTDAGDLAAAYEAWRVVLRLVPAHVGAMKGMAFVRFQQGELAEAERLLIEAHRHEQEPDEITDAIRNVRQSGPRRLVGEPAAELPGDPRHLFAGVLEEEHAAILLDTEGLVLAGAYSVGGRDVTEDVGATLSGVSGEANRATRHLNIGAWRSITFEAQRAVVSLTPVGVNDTGPSGLLLLAAPPTTPLGLLHRVLDRCLARAREWLGPGGSAR